MALTDSQKTKIRGYLGYTLDSTEIDAALVDLSVSAEAEVVALLTQLADVDTRFNTTARDVAGLETASTVKFFQGQAIADLVSLGNDLVMRLASFLGVEIVRLPFGGQSVSGIGLAYFGA
jgi:hypothetical protein